MPCPPARPHLQRLSGISSRLLLAAMNSSRLASLPMPEGSPSKSRLLEFRYSFFSLVSLQMADWRESRQGRVRAAARVAQQPSCPPPQGWTHRQGGELISGQVQGLHVHPLVDAQGQLCNLVAAEVEAAQAGESVQALGHPRQVVAGQVHVWSVGEGASARAPPGSSSAARPCPNPAAPPPGSVAFSASLNLPEPPRNSLTRGV